MGHGITAHDNVFSVRKPMWHGLGTVLEGYPTVEEARELVHPWEPITETLYRRSYAMDEQGNPSEYMEAVEGWQANVRSDNSNLLGITRDTYEPVKNEVMYEIASALEGEGQGQVMLETGGSLNGGAKVWLLMRFYEPITVNAGARAKDPTATIPYFSLQNAHDGSASFRGQATMTRIVCQNTAHMADMDARARGTEFTFRHSKNVHDRIEEARKALMGWRESVHEYQRFSEHLLGVKVTADQVNEYVERFFPIPAGQVISNRVSQNIEDARYTWLEMYRDSETNEGIEGTAYGILHASVEYLNHARRSHTQETRFRRTFLDRDKMTQQATKLMLEVTGA